MTNAEKFKFNFGLYATELWAMSEEPFLSWLNSAYEKEGEKGKWIEDETGYGYWTCSRCGFVTEASAANILYHFCPNCGADMRSQNT